MERRRFLESCAAVTGAASLGALEGAWANATPRSYPRARLVDARGTPLRARAVATQTNYVFHYPYASTPCFLLRLVALEAGLLVAGTTPQHTAQLEKDCNRHGEENQRQYVDAAHHTQLSCPSLNACDVGCRSGKNQSDKNWTAHRATRGALDASPCAAPSRI